MDIWWIGEVSAEPKWWAIFDLDWTLIRPLKGKYATGPWTWLPGRKEKLKKLVEEGWSIAILTNQKPNPKKSKNTIIQILTQVHEDLNKEDIPNIILTGLANEEYRKPNVGWLKHLALKEGSFMVGDAAGRPEDFSDSDIGFAKNARIPFYLPEEMFPFRPPELIGKTLIIEMGAPASGKSTYAKELEKIGFIRIESDAFKSSFPRIYKAVEKSLATGNNVVIDATNPTRERRMIYINIAKNMGYRPIIFHFLNSGEDRNKLREKKVPQIAFNTYWSRLEPPDSSVEGVEVVEVI